MTQKILSVVIPTYNMEAYLRRCLDSVTRSDVPDTLELIVVNDGSTDGSLAIMQEYAAKRPDIVNVIDKPNGHYGSCVNAALKVATGKYFRILDADDWFDTDSLITILKKFDKINSDAIVAPYCKHYSSYSKTFLAKNVQYEKQYDIHDENVWKSQGRDYFIMHSVIYKLDVIKKSHLHMTEGICFTDCEYLIYPACETASITFLKEVLYNYNLARDGQSIDPNEQAKNYKDLAIIIKKMIPSFLHFPNFAVFVATNLLVLFYYRMIFLCVDDSELKEIDNLLKKCNPVFYKNLNRALWGTPYLWRMFGMHFLFYEKIKKWLNIDRR